MSLESDIDLLARVPLFSDLGGDHLRLLAFSSLRHDFAGGAVLFKRGDAARSGFALASGAVELAIGEGAARRVIETCGAGCLIGELPLFVDSTRRATATAVQPVSAFEITRQVMTRMLGEYPDLAALLHRRLEGRLRGTIADLRRVRASLLAIGSRA